MPVETLTIPLDGRTVTAAGYYTSDSANRIEVSGTYRRVFCDSIHCPLGATCDYERFGDAEYLTDDCWDSVSDSLGVDNSVLVDGEPIDWGPSSSDHVYSTEVNGRNGPFSFRSADCSSCYGKECRDADGHDLRRESVNRVFHAPGTVGKPNT